MAINIRLKATRPTKSQSVPANKFRTTDMYHGTAPVSHNQASVVRYPVTYIRPEPFHRLASKASSVGAAYQMEKENPSEEPGFSIARSVVYRDQLQTRTRLQTRWPFALVTHRRVTKQLATLSGAKRSETNT